MRTPKTPQTLEEMLVAYVERGDEDAMEALVARTRGRLLRAVRSVAGDAEAEDAVQAAYLALLRTRSVRSVEGWLFTAAVRIAYRRRAKERRETELARRLGAEHAAPRAAADRIDAELVRREVARLPARFRDVVVLHHLSGLATAEIARLLDVDPTTVRTRLHRGRRLLRSRLGPRLAHGLLAVPWLVHDAAALISGGILMTRKAALVAVVLVLSLAGGVGVWRVVRDDAGPRTRGATTAERTPAPTSHDAAKAGDGDVSGSGAAGVAMSEREAALRGVVVDPSGAPLEGIAVLGFDDHVAWLEPQSIEGLLARTDERGRFVIRDLRDAKTLVFAGTGYVPAQREPVPPLSVVLEPARVVEAMVRDRAGRPIPDATVTASGVGPKQRVFTGDDGRVRFATVPSVDGVWLSANAIGYQPPEVPLQRPAREVTFVLKRAGLLVDVVDAGTGAPVGSAGAVFVRQGERRRLLLPVDQEALGELGLRERPGLIYRTLFAEQGEEEVVVDVHVFAPGYRPHAERVSWKAGAWKWKAEGEIPQRTVRLARGRGGPVLAGRVVPAMRASVEVRLDWPHFDDRSAAIRVATVEADTRGRFAMAGLPAGEYRLVATASGFGPVGADVTLPDTDVRLEMERAATLEVVARDATGAPAAGTWLHVEAGRRWWEFRADGKGRVLAGGLTPGELAVFPLRGHGRMVGPRYEGPRRTVSVGPGETKRIEMTVPVTRPLTVRVRDDGERALHDVEVVLLAWQGYAFHRHPDHRGRTRGRTDAQGEFEARVWPGRYEVIAKAGTARLSRRVEIGLDGNDPGAVELVASSVGPVVRGRVHDAATGEAVAGARVRAWTRRRTHAEGRVDRDGRYALHGVPREGEVRILVWWSGGRAWRDIEIGDASTVEVDFPVPRGAARVPFSAVVRDAADGRPLRSVSVEVRARYRGVWLALAQGYTDAEGRIEARIPALDDLLVVVGEETSGYDAVRIRPDALEDVVIELPRK